MKKVVMLFLAVAPLFLIGCGESQYVSTSPDKARLAQEKYGGVIATEEQYRDVFGEPSERNKVAEKYGGILATKDQYDEHMAASDKKP